MRGRSWSWKASRPTASRQAAMGAPASGILPEWPQIADCSILPAKADRISFLALGHPPHPSPITILS